MHPAGTTEQYYQKDNGRDQAGVDVAKEQVRTASETF